MSTNMSVLDSYGSGALSLPPPLASSRGHQRSRTTNERPPLFSRTPSVSPTRSSTFMSFARRSRDSSPNPWTSTTSVNSEAPSTESQKRIRPGTVGKIASWFEGASEPVNLTLVPSPRKEKPEPFFEAGQFEETESRNSQEMDNLTQRPQSKSSSSTTASRFNFFKRATTTTPKADPDELTHLDVREALLPDGPPEEISPAAYKNLQLSAEALLRRFQVAYAENLGALRGITMEKSVQVDEMEAANTRNEALKFQLLEMAERSSEQERIIASLQSQLAAPQPSIRMINDEDHFTSSRHIRRNRVSDISSSDESFVDSEVSSAVSIFSDVESIRTPSSSVAVSPTMKHASLYSPTVVQRPQMRPQITPVLVSECQNCHNVPASEAWDVIEMMKLESAALKERISELEMAQDSALDLLTTLKF